MALKHRWENDVSDSSSDSDARETPTTRNVFHRWEHESREQQGVQGTRKHKWEGDLPDLIDSDDEDFDGDDSGVEDNPQTRRDTAANEFIAILNDLYLCSKISAEIFAVLCYWAHVGGMNEEVGRLGKKSGGQFSKYTQHLDRKFKFKSETARQYNIQMAGHRKHDVSRSKFKIGAFPGHETLHEELVQDESWKDDLIAMKASQGLPRNYYQHPVVQQNPDQLVVPYAIYLDGLPYSLCDSVLGVWLVNLVSQRRHLMTLLRKRLTCKCGCLGWCSHFGILQFIKCVIQSLADGIFFI